MWLDIFALKVRDWPVNGNKQRTSLSLPSSFISEYAKLNLRHEMRTLPCFQCHVGSKPHVLLWQI